MIDYARLLAEAQLSLRRGVAERHQTAVREAHFVGRQLQGRINGVELGDPCVELVRSHLRSVGRSRKQRMPHADERLVAPWYRKQMTRRPAENCVAIATHPLHGEAVF
jgi:hypothetical protein